MTILRNMLVTDLHGHRVEITRFRDKYPQYVIARVTATLVGYGIEIEREFTDPVHPQIGDRLDIEL